MIYIKTKKNNNENFSDASSFTNPAIGAGIGAILAGGAGYLSTKEKKDRLKNALLAALGGAALGGAAGYGYDQNLLGVRDTVENHLGDRAKDKLLGDLPFVGAGTGAAAGAGTGLLAKSKLNGMYDNKYRATSKDLALARQHLRDNTAELKVQQKELDKLDPNSLSHDPKARKKIIGKQLKAAEKAHLAKSNTDLAADKVKDLMGKRGNIYLFKKASKKLPLVGLLGGTVAGAATEKVITD